MKIASDIELMKLHAATLFIIDRSGRLRGVREPGYPREPPRFFMGRTPEGNVWYFRHDLRPELVDQLNGLCREEPIASDFSSPPRSADKIRAAIEAQGPTIEERGPSYLVPDHVRPRNETVEITRANGHLLEAEFTWMRRRISNDDDIGPVTAAVENGDAVSICYCARLAPLAAEAGVQTPEHLRGRGYAPAAVAAWAVACRGRGVLPLYSTSWENTASRRIASKLGLLQYGEDRSLE